MKNIQEIAKKIEEAGGRLYLVGGAVRDEILGIKNHDEDYLVVGLNLSDFVNIFPDAKIVGEAFPVFLIDGCEFALARSEKKVGEGYKGFEVHTASNITIEEDLARRDLTINAIAKDVLTGQIIDPFNGKSDIENKIIRHVSDAFSDDPLRAYRAARFAAKYDFDIASETLELMKKQRKELETITKERIFLELKKALEGEAPSKFFVILKDAGMLDIHFKELQDLIGAEQPVEYHPEGDAFIHSMIVLDKVASKTDDVSVRFAALVHDLGKGVTPKEEYPHHIDHDIKGKEIVRNMCNRLKLPSMWKKKGMEVAEYHMKAENSLNMRPYKQAILFNKLLRSAIGIRNLEIIANADDMINREKRSFADIAEKMFNTVSGRTLIDEGINPNEIGVEKFSHRLLERQASVLKSIEQEKEEITLE